MCINYYVIKQYYCGICLYVYRALVGNAFEGLVFYTLSPKARVALLRQEAHAEFFSSHKGRHF